MVSVRREGLGVHEADRKEQLAAQAAITCFQVDKPVPPMA